MKLPFTAEEFFGVFARYNQSVWPMQVVLNVLAITVIALVCRGRRSDSRYISAILFSLWAWVAIAYHILFFRRMTPAAWLFAVVFAIGAVSFLWSGGIGNLLRFRLGSGSRTLLGGFWIGFALVIYPVLGHVLGHRYPAVPTFGTPCPTTIFTFGVLFFAAEPIPKSVLVMPLVWAAIGSLAAFQLGVLQDLGLLGSALTILVLPIIAPASPSAI